MTRLATLVLLTVPLVPAAAWAQVGPGTLPTGGPAGAGEEEDGKDGVAEAAPATPGLLPTTPTLPPPRGKRNRFELFELDGYLRFRGDWFKNFNLSFRDEPALGGAPFPRPLGCTPAGTGTPGSATDRPCGDTIKSANMRLLLAPRINVTETTSVHLQVNVLDNIVLGSTPLDPDQLAVLGDTQAPPQAGVNWERDSIVVNRAWAEVATPLGVLKFGRMPDHWGLGILHNSGYEDPIHGDVDLDADYGDTVDRVMFGTLIPGTRLRAAVAMDWPRTLPVSTQTDLHRGGQGWDLDDNDDVTQWSFIVSQMSTPTEFRDAVDRGELAINYGVYFTYRTQGWSYDASGLEIGESPDPDAFVPRDARAYIPDVWARLGWKNFLVELEAVAVLGSVDRLTDLDVDESVSLRQWGAVGRFSYRALEDKLQLGIEVGAASGDQYDNVPAGQTHVRYAQDLPSLGDDTISWFRFDPDYKVDLILWRELIGQVTNAVYAKPFFGYQLTNSIGLKVANITSFAIKPVATPGNAILYGTEFDASLGYSSGAFHAGLAYGVFFPLSAMNHPTSDITDGGAGFDWGPADENAGDAGNAHTIQAYLTVTF